MLCSAEEMIRKLASLARQENASGCMSISSSIGLVRQFSVKED